MDLRDSLDGTTLRMKGKTGEGYKYVTTTTDELQPCIFTHSTTDPELEHLKNNIKALKELCSSYNEKTILNHFKFFII